MTIATNGALECKPGVPVASPAGVGLAPSFGRNAQWFILQTKANAERYARDALKAPYRGCTVYLPLELVVVVHAGRKREIERAFFPRYLFVLDQGQGVPVMRTAPGVSHVVKCGDQPAMIAQRFIDQIEDQEAAGYELKHAPFVVRYSPGETVRVNDGPFVSFNGVFERWLNGEQRATILVDIFGRPTPVELEPDQFEKL